MNWWHEEEVVYENSVYREEKEKSQAVLEIDKVNISYARKFSSVSTAQPNRHNCS